MQDQMFDRDTMTTPPSTTSLMSATVRCNPLSPSPTCPSAPPSTDRFTTPEASVSRSTNLPVAADGAANPMV